MFSLLCSVQFDGHYAVSGAYDYLVKVWDPLQGTCVHTLQGHTNRVYSLRVSAGLREVKVRHGKRESCVGSFRYRSSCYQMSKEGE